MFTRQQGRADGTTYYYYYVVGDRSLYRPDAVLSFFMGFNGWGHGYWLHGDIGIWDMWYNGMAGVRHGDDDGCAKRNDARSWSTTNVLFVLFVLRDIGTIGTIDTIDTIGTT